MMRSLPTNTLLIALLFAAPTLVRADDAPPEAETEPAATDDVPETTPKEKPPSLDDLLGLEGESGDAEEATEDAAEEELERRLSDTELSNVFLAAVERMRDAHDRLQDTFDTGLGTQRAQQDVLAKLESLIDEAKKRQQSGSSSSSSPGQQQPSPSQSPGKQQRSPPEAGQPQASPAAGSGESTESGESPPPQTGALDSILDESESEWGHLPERIRELLLQGRREKFSSLYERMTREYYRRLAEEG